MDAAEHILLTGAGFTRNFGAPLAREIWSLIQAHRALVAAHRVRDLLLQDLDYESVYQTVLSGAGYSSDEQDALSEAVWAAYDSIDEGLRNWNFTPGSPDPVNLYSVNRFLNRFSGTGDHPGIIFTLNQDLFVERYYSDGIPLLLLGLGRTSKIPGGARVKVVPENRVCLPTEVPSFEEAARKHGFFYVKMHGSSNWIAADGASRMVIGQAKSAEITSEPLLAMYLEAFERVLSTGTRRLLIIGYGFRDEHINQVIASAIKRGNLQIFVVSPQAPTAFKQMLDVIPCGPDIWGALYGYYPHTLLSLFPQDGSGTPAWRQVRNTYFGEGR